MLKLIQAEWLKQKRSVNHKLILIITLIAILLAYLLMGPGYVFMGAFNWWYITYLPFIFTYIAASIVKKDEKRNYHGLLAVAVDKKKLWYAKIIVAILYLIEANGIILITLFLTSILLGAEMPVIAAIVGSIALIITFAWQIPFFMYLSQKLGLFICVVISLFCNLGIACIAAVKSCWWIPFSIPARLMCPIVGILPNGLLVAQANKSMADKGVIIPGILITVLLLAGISYWTAQRFVRKEV